MKIAWKTAAVLAVLYVLALMGYRTLGALWNPPLIQKKNEAFLASVQAQRFEEAAGLFAGDTVNADWPEAMRSLHENASFRLLSYENVKARFDDGSYGTGHADLVFEIDGQAVPAHAVLTFRQGGMPGQICAITPTGADQTVKSAFRQWNELVCGGEF